MSDLDTAILAWANTLPRYGLAPIGNGWTYPEIALAARRIALGLSVSNSEYQVAMSMFHARKR